MDTLSATPDLPGTATVAVRWFHCKLSHRIGYYPERDERNIPRELREAADEFERYRNWECPEGKPLIIRIKMSDDTCAFDAVKKGLESSLGLKHMSIDSMGFDIKKQTEKGR